MQQSFIPPSVACCSLMWSTLLSSEQMVESRIDRKAGLTGWTLVCCGHQLAFCTSISTHTVCVASSPGPVVQARSQSQGLGSNSTPRLLRFPLSALSRWGKQCFYHVQQYHGCRSVSCCCYCSLKCESMTNRWHLTLQALFCLVPERHHIEDLLRFMGLPFVAHVSVISNPKKYSLDRGWVV